VLSSEEAGNIFFQSVNNSIDIKQITLDSKIITDCIYSF